MANNVQLLSYGMAASSHFRIGSQMPWLTPTEMSIPCGLAQGIVL